MAFTQIIGEFCSLKMNKQITDIIYSAITGDASGYTLDGLKKAHISAVFRDAEGYPDPSPALKNSMERWKKPGFYSSITQFMLLASACTDSRTFYRGRFIEAVANSPELPDTEYSYFRNPGPAERNFIASVKSGEATPFTKPCARILPAAIPLLFIENRAGLLPALLEYVSLFTRDITTAVHAYFFIRLLSDILKSGRGDKLLNTASGSVADATADLTENQHSIFTAGYNPDYFLAEGERYSSLIRKLEGTADIERAGKIICDSANTRLKTPIARASANLPECILPLALYLSAGQGDPGEIFHRASREGGAASALAAAAGAITCAYYGINIPAHLAENMANKKKISTILEIISLKSDRGGLVKILHDSEPGLTLKEIEEFRARNKNEVKTQKTPKTRKDVESELTRHVVESWTKVDKAKWRKERNRHET